ncbi:50S ribosomal protein L4 [bacterium]|nr:50S ribosomal protein L4 [bacterium]
MKLDVYKIDGSASGEQLTLSQKVFGIKPNDHAIWFSVTSEMTNRRQGTVSTKNRSAVRGGGRKPWRQKGTGRARAGSIRSPLWVGGGRVFGPAPKNYFKQIPKKMNRLARRSALSHKAKEGEIRLVEDFTFEKPKTKQMVEILRSLQLDTVKILLIVPQTDKSIWLSSRNLPGLSVKAADGFSTYDVLKAKVLLIQKSAISKINEVLGK